MSNVCQQCKCTPAEAMADALFLGLEKELESGIYRCCEIVAWADEQWRAWTEAANEDCQVIESESERMVFQSGIDVQTRNV
jgi:hypothetical protein